ncbi:oxysterol-binding protein 1 isoform X2 [Harmonia axyridis]|uniref:oxysterol-binding protein 1 isoform X2 n=1 Tax=Harmonia axyridis TaxID=115357 RepID=UPI001E276187|nr:oxysterol-binding protein 1 isoform X2 [Harmonia axyridis]
MGDSGTAKSASGQNEPAMKGWLFKWTNYLKGYQRRWFVLQNGHLSYYRVENNGAVSTLSLRRRRKFKSGNQAEMAHTCRGSISLHGALIYTVDATTFVISNGGTQTFHIRAASEVERQSWVTALELAKAKAMLKPYISWNQLMNLEGRRRSMESEDDEEQEVDGSGNPEEWSSVIRKLEAQLNDLETCSELIQKHWKSLCKPLNELESSNGDLEICQGKTKEVGERATLFRISTNAMINACMEYLKTCQTHGNKWIRLLEHEREQRMRLQEMVETLAQQHSNLEQAANAHSHKPMNANEAEEEDEHEFYDAINDNPGSPGSTGDNCITFNIPTGNTHRRHSSGSSSEVDEAQETKHVVVVTEKARKITHPEQPTNNMLSKSSDSSRKRRTRIPDKPNYPLNLWGIMKNCIGKDLSKIPMPVNFSEPLSMLQRLTEDYEYADILDVAAKCTDPCEQLAYVAAFTISAYSTTAIRAAKPFNPLLGETYECDRTEDLGWKVINEQVSHHPPMVAQFCEGRGWTCWQEFTMTSKFRGKYLQIIPLGSAFCEFKESNNKYSWRKVTTTVHNIIVGKLWVDQHGDMEIIGRGNAEGIKCHLKFIPYSYFGRDSQRRVKGVVMDAQDNVKWAIDGTWDEQVEVSPVISDMGTPSNPVYKTGSPVLAWKRNPIGPEAENYYNLSVFACQLNEMEEGVAPTDSRLRPDQRLMEMGKWDEANEEKLRLEEKQRAVRRQKEAEAEKAASEGRSFEGYKPLWFEQKEDPATGTIMHVYKGNYWDCKQKQDWSSCPDIF